MTNDIGIADLGPPIAHGRTAEVYAWPSDCVLKLFHTWIGPGSVQREAEIARAVHAAGVPSPAVGEVVQVDDRTGIVYARVDGQSMLAALTRRPWQMRRHAHRLAALHAQMHALPMPAIIPDQQVTLARKIDQAAALTAAQRDAALAVLAAMPTGTQLCHGDFHPDNVMLTAAGPVIIDWLDATRGRPAADVARTSIILRAAAETGQIRNPLQRAFVRAFHRVYLARYGRLRPGEEAEYRRWLPLVAAARLSEGIAEVEAWLVNMAGG